MKAIRWLAWAWPQLGLGNLAQAESYYKQSLALHRAIKSLSGMGSDLASLSDLALKMGDVKTAQQYVSEILTLNIESFWAPWFIYYTVYQVFQAGGRSDQAQDMLEKAHSFLQAGAERISDDALRESFLQKVDLNRNIMQAWQSSK